MEERELIKRRETLEIYSNLIGTEIKSLSGRMSDITSAVSKFMSGFDTLAMQLEEITVRVDALQNSLEFCRSEITEIRKILVEHLDKNQKPEVPEQHSS